MDTKTGWADLNFIQLHRVSGFQTFYISRRETDSQVRTQMNRDSPGFAVVICGNSAREFGAQLLCTPGCPFVFVMHCHEFSPMRDTIRSNIASTRLLYA